MSITHQSLTTGSHFSRLSKHLLQLKGRQVLGSCLVFTALALSACGGGGSSSTTTGGTGTTGTTSTGTTSTGSGTSTVVTIKEYEGTYTISNNDVTINFKVSPNGTVTSCYSDAVYVCSGLVNTSGSFNIQGNDGETPVDTSATLEGTIDPATGNVVGSFKAQSASEGASSGTFTGSKTTASTSAGTSSGGTTSGSTGSTSGSSTTNCTLANATLGTGPALTSTPPAPCYKGREYTFGWTEKGVIGDACRAAQTPSLNDDLVTFKAKNISACYCKPQAKVNSVTMNFVCHVFFDPGN